MFIPASIPTIHIKTVQDPYHVAVTVQRDLHLPPSLLQIGSHAAAVCCTADSADSPVHVAIMPERTKKSSGTPEPDRLRWITYKTEFPISVNSDYYGLLAEMVDK